MVVQANKIGVYVVRLVNGAVNWAVLAAIVLMVIFAGYSLWDSGQLYRAADSSQYTVYKPTEMNEGKSFEELRTINPEVIAWLTVYGTHIDYPVTQGPDNMKYVNTNAEGQYMLSGSIFLDTYNCRDFSDFNHIIYGHHMAHQAMFGQIGEFAQADMFSSRMYGNIYFGGKDHGIEFFAFVHTDAYDASVFTPNVPDKEHQAYLDNLLELAVHKRDIGVTIQDHIILLSTCSASSTNGRDILAGRIVDAVYEDTFFSESSVRTLYGIDSQTGQPRIALPVWLTYEALITVALLVFIISVKRVRGRKQIMTGGGHDHDEVI
ncbi:MAG: class B sortase [Clostridia bacterium]|nr:class B sortase [Clostridia bacterium]